jgi:ATP-dependent DNA helicase RecG
MPPGRSPVTTRVLAESRRGEAYAAMRHAFERGQQAYLVYPLVEETENSDLLAATEGAGVLAKQVFPEFRVGLLHGRMTPEEKQATMASFKRGDLDLLVSTTVIEVGIDVPNASLMVVEHAERFGLAQLHQLRGRVGRGDERGLCLLIKSVRCSEDGNRRLSVMQETTDGFRIAEADLEIRGPGEFLGTRQSGLPDFRIANILRDSQLLEAARQDAFQLVQTIEQLPPRESRALLDELRQRWGQRLELATIG